MITLGLDRGDVEHFMDDSDKFRLIIGTEAGESRAIDAIEEVLKKLGSVIEEVDHAKYLMYIEHGTDDLMMDELVRIENWCADTPADKLDKGGGLGVIMN